MKIHLISLLAFLICVNTWANDMWQHDKYNVQIKVDNKYLKMGQYFHISTDKSMTKIDIPENWKIEKAYFSKQSFVIIFKDKISIEVPRDKMGKLSFDILKLGPQVGKPKDDDLEKLWQTYNIKGRK